MQTITAVKSNASPDEAAAEAIQSFHERSRAAVGMAPAINGVRALLSSLDALGLSDELAACRVELRMITVIREESAAVHARAKEDRRDLVARVAAGGITLDQVTADLAALAPWLPISGGKTTAGGKFVQDVIEERERRALLAAREQAPGVFRPLAERARAAADRAVAAGPVAADVRGIASWIMAVRRMADNPRSAPTGGLAELSPMPLPVLTDLQTDVRRATAWAEASTAVREFSAIHHAAHLVRTVVRTPAMHPALITYGAQMHSSDADMLARVPGELQLAVAAALGLKPGLYAPNGQPYEGERDGVLARLARSGQR